MHVSAPYAGRLSTSAPQEKGLLASPHTPRTYLPHPARDACLPAPQTPRACLPAPIREGHICHILRGALACQHPARGACYQHLIREVFANAPYAECWQAPVREVLANSPYARCFKRPICRAYEAHPHIPGTNPKEAAGGTLLPGQTAKETAGALLVGQAPPPRNP